MEDLINNLNKATEDINASDEVGSPGREEKGSGKREQKRREKTREAGEAGEEEVRGEGEEDIERKRKELLILASDGLISKSVTSINKASTKVILKLYAEYEEKRLDESAEFLCDLFLSKFSEALGGLDAIEESEEMEKELLRNPLLKADIKKICKWITPIIPFIGILSGGFTVGKYVYKKSGVKEKDDTK